MKRAYQKPTMIRIDNTKRYAKHGLAATAQHPVMTEISGISVNELINEYGSPLFVFDEGRVRDNYRLWYQSFADRYPKVTFGWSYKTNYLKAICAILHSEGAIAEVVSDFEYHKARAMGVPGSQIILNGPYKTDAVLKQAAQEHAMINCDNFDEISRLEKIAEGLHRKINVGLRVNMKTGQCYDWSRFGFNLETHQAINAVKRIAAMNKLNIETLHCHIGTFVLEPNAYTEACTKLVEFKKQIEVEFGYQIKNIDMGGGFPSLSHLRGIYQPPEVTVPEPWQYAEAITSVLLKNFKRDELPRLFLESGRALVDDAGYLITSVVGQKPLPDGRRSYILDAGVNLLYTSTWYRYKIAIDRELRGLPQPTILNGPLCMNIDSIDEALMIPRLETGTRMILSPVGAYNVTQSMQFIQYRPAMVLIAQNGTHALIRKREQLDDVEAQEILPNFLADSKIKVA